MKTLSFPYLQSMRLISLPDEWIGEVVEPRSPIVADHANTLIKEALDHPIGCAPLAGLVRPDQSISIIVDDHTRKTPIHHMLPPVLAELQAAGVPEEKIRIVVALGTHRPMTEAEILDRLGAEIRREYTVINVSSGSENEMVYLGESYSGIPAYVNRAVAEAEVRIGLGMITPHLDAGFSGGMKIILPGVCGTPTVDAFHAQSAFLTGNQLGQVDAPLRCALEQFVSQHAPLTFIVNAILTPDEQLYACVAGHPLQAHRQGVKHAQAVYSVPVKRRYPIVVANCYPYDLDLWQSIKGIWAGDLFTADGGTLIVVTAAPEGNSTYSLVPVYVGRDPDEVKREIETGAAEDAKQAATGVMLRTLMRRIRLVLVSDGLTAEDARRMGIDFYPNVEKALAVEIDRLPGSARQEAVCFVPQAGIVSPMIDQVDRHQKEVEQKYMTMKHCDR
jgi:nickel-dependent lactate racemase